MSLEMLDLIVCPICQRQLSLEGIKINCLVNRSHQFSYEDGIVLMGEDFRDDSELSRKKWDLFYDNDFKQKDYYDLENRYRQDNFENVYRQLNQANNLKDKVFLEVGCGPFIFGQLLATECALVIGVDFSYPALKIAKEMVKEKGLNNVLLIYGDIKNMPIKNGCVDVLYGGGVIEHFKETQPAVNEFYRVLKPGGIAFNTVPALNLGSLTYRQVWGNIPSFPVLKQLAELIHIKLLGARHMVFGYELSFSARELTSIHRKAGFKKVTVTKFKTKLLFNFIPGKTLKNIFIWMADNIRLFWPMYKVVAEK